MYIINKKGNLVSGNETLSDFVRFAKLKDLKKFSKTSNQDLGTLLKKDSLLSWIKIGDRVVKGTDQTQGFTGYATEAEIKEAGGKPEQAEIFRKDKKKSNNS